MPTRPILAMQRSLLGLFALLLIASVVVGVFVFGGDRAAPRSLAGDGNAERIDDPVRDSPTLAGSGGAASDSGTGSSALAASERRTVDGASETTANAATDGPRWSDLLRPVDALTLAPIAGTRVKVVDGSGGLLDLPLDAFVDLGLVADAGVIALDGPHHAPRPFDARSAARMVSGPHDVLLHPTVSLTLELAEPLAPERFTIRLEVLTAETAASHRDTALLRQTGIELARALDPEAGEGARYSGANTLQGNFIQLADLGQRDLLALAGPPAAALAANRPEVLVASFPHEIVGLPALGSVLLGPSGNSFVEFTAADGSVWTRLGGAQVELPREGSTTVKARYLGYGSVFGWLPTPLNDGKIEIGQRIVGEEWSPNLSGAADESGSFWFETVVSGDHQLLATWKDETGVARRATRTFTVVAGGEVDLGLLEPHVGTTIVLEPVIVVDGDVDRTRLDGVRFSYSLSSDSAFLERAEAASAAIGSTALDDIFRSMGEFRELHYGAQDSFTGARGVAVGPEPVTLTGLTGDRFGLILFNTRLPEDLVGRFTDPVWSYEPVFDAHGSTTRMIVLHLTTATRLELTAYVSVPAASDIQFMNGFAWNHATEEFQLVSFEDSGLHMAKSVAPWVTVGSTRLTPGTWTVAVNCTSYCFSDDDESSGTELQQLEFGQVASATITFESGDSPHAIVQLAPGAAVTGALDAFVDEVAASNRRVQVYPTELGPSAASFWYGFAADDDAGGSSITISTLLPNTEYRVKGTDRTFHTGPGGTTVELAR